jgi:hypothetical protein
MPLYPALAVCAGVALAALWDRRAGGTGPATASPPTAGDDADEPADQPSPATA